MSLFFVYTLFITHSFTHSLLFHKSSVSSITRLTTIFHQSSTSQYIYPWIDPSSITQSDTAALTHYTSSLLSSTAAMCRETQHHLRPLPCAHAHTQTKPPTWSYCASLPPTSRTQIAGRSCRKYKFRVRDTGRGSECLECKAEGKAKVKQ